MGAVRKFGCAALTLVAATSVAATSACVRYRAAPLNPGALPADYRSRRLTDSTLVAYVTAHAGPPGDSGWTDAQLAVAALRLRSELTRARAEWRSARAAERSAGGRPQPGVEASLERAISGAERESPWVASVAALVTVELGGKRGARLAVARAGTAEAEAELRLTAWRIAHEVRAAALTVRGADAAISGTAAEAVLLARVQALARSRYAEAVLTGSELARGATDLATAGAAAAAARRDALLARGRLARATGLPVPAVESLALSIPPPGGCAWLAATGPTHVAATALRRRVEIGLALARYAGAEAELRLRAAGQYPDLSVGPGFIWDQGVNRWTLALALPGLLGYRNRGPLEEGRARRRVAAAQVAEAQEMVLGEVASAELGCRGAGLTLAAATGQVRAAEATSRSAGAAYRRGETTRFEPALASLALARARRGLGEAEAARREASIELEAAAGVWVGRGTRWPDPRAARSSAGSGP